MPSKAWKNLERSAAAALGGRRNVRTDFFQSLPDVDHPSLSIECKHRKQLPRLLRLGLEQAARYAPEKIPILIIKQKYQKGALAVLRLDDLKTLLEGRKGTPENHAVDCVNPGAGPEPKS